MSNFQIKQVDTGVFRGPRPSSIGDFMVLQKMGVRTILNLERGWFEALHGRVNEEFTRAEIAKITPLHVELSDLLPPAQSIMASILSILQNPEYRPVYVHCLHGVDRTGFVCAAYRGRVQGWTYPTAMREMLDLGFHNWAYWWWKGSLKQYFYGSKAK